MATKQFGVEAVVKGLGKFLNDIGKINAAYDSNSKAIKTAQDNLEKMGQKADKLASRYAASMDRQKKATLSLATAGINLERAQRALQGAADKSAKAQNDLADRISKAENAQERATITNDAAKRSVQELVVEQAKLSAETRQASDALTNLGSEGGGATTAMSSLAAVGSGAGLALTAIGAAASVAVGGLRLFVNMVKSVYDAVVKVIQAFGQWISRVTQIASAILFADVLRQISRGLRELSKDVIQAAAEFQRLQIQFEALITRDIAKEFGIPYEQAMQGAAETAKRLLVWVQRLAIQSPFTVQSIARTMAMANAFGLAIPLAQELTVAVGNFAAGMGLTEDHMERIIYNFGQMVSQGKLTGREFRDLAISFVPMETLLIEMAEEAGMAKDAFRKLALEGGVPVQAFFDKFVQFSEEAFPGAAKRMTRTLTGVINKIKDFAQVVVGMQILGPVLDVITGKMADFIDILLTPEVIKGANMLGQVLLRSFNILSEAFNTYLVPAITNLRYALGLAGGSAESFAIKMAAVAIFISKGFGKIQDVIDQVTLFINRRLRDTGANAQSFGYNLIAMLAKGMAAAAKLVVTVINGIAKIISFFFKGQSPPRIAPEIDRWGEDLVGEYFDGMETAARKRKDSQSPFNVIGEKFQTFATDTARDVTESSGAITGAIATIAEDIGESIEEIAKRVIAELSRFSADAMTGLVSSFSSADFSAFEDISGLIERFLRALPTGGIGETELIPRILGTRESIAQSIASFRGGMINIDQAINNVLESAVSASREFGNYITSLFNAEAATAVLNKAQLELSTVQDLSIKNLRKVNTLLNNLTGDVRRYATEYVNSLRAMAVVEAELENAQADLNRTTKYYTDLLADLKAQLTEVTDEYAEQERLADIQAAINTGLLTEKELARLTAEQRAIALRQQIRETERQRDVEVDAAKDRVDSAQEARDALGAMMEEQRDFLMDMVEAQYELAKAQSDAAEEQLTVALKTIEVQIRQNELIQEQIDLLNQLADSSRGGGAGGDEDMGVDVDDPMGGMGSLDLPEIEDISGWVDEIFADAEKMAEGWVKDISAIFETAFEGITWKGLTDAITNLNTELDGAVTSVQKWWKNFKQVLEFFQPKYADVIGRIADNMGRITDSLERMGLLPEGGGSLGGLINFLAFIANTAAIAALEFLNDQLDRFADVMERWADVIEKWQPEWDALTERLENAEGLYETVSVLWDMLWTGIVEAVELAVQPIITLIEESLIGQIIKLFLNLYKELVGDSIVPDIMNGIYDIVTDKSSEILESWIQWGSDLVASAREKWEAAKKDISDRMELIRSNIDTKVAEIRTFWEERWQAIKDWAYDRWEEIKETVETAALAVQKFIEDPVGAIVTFWEEKWQAVKDWFEGIWNDPDGIVQKAKTAAADLESPFKEGGALAKTLTWIRTTVLDPLAKGFNAVGTAIEGMIGWVNTLVSRLLQSDVGQALTKLGLFKKDSPPPLAAGFDEVSRAIARFSNYAVPLLTTSLANVPAPATSPTASAAGMVDRSIHINVDANYAATQSPVGIYHDVTAALMAVNNR